jgi:hypothetical protein
VVVAGCSGEIWVTYERGFGLSLDDGTVKQMVEAGRWVSHFGAGARCFGVVGACGE